MNSPELLLKRDSSLLRYRRPAWFISRKVTSAYSCLPQSAPPMWSLLQSAPFRAQRTWATS